MSANPAEPPRARRSGCATALMLIAGCILLLPGLCVAITAIATLPDLVTVLVNSANWQQRADPLWLVLSTWAVFWAFCIAISIGGVALIVWTIRRP